MTIKRLLLLSSLLLTVSNVSSVEARAVVRAPGQSEARPAAVAAFNVNKTAREVSGALRLSDIAGSGADDGRRLGSAARGGRVRRVVGARAFEHRG